MHAAKLSLPQRVPLAGFRWSPVPARDGCKDRAAVAWRAPIKSYRRGCVTSIQPELWVEEGRKAVAFYEAAFGATTLHFVGEGDDIVA